MEFCDDYNHDVPGVIYFPRSLPCKEIENLYDYTLEGCNCEKDCTVYSDCSCIRRSGTFYTFDNISDFENYTINENSVKRPTYECNENCNCKNRTCGNRLVQFGPRKNLRVEACGNDKGLGLITSDHITNGNLVCEYAGEIITEKQALERFNIIGMKNQMNYIFCIKEHFGEELVKTFIDPMYYGNIGRYINHSCEPNCKLYVVRINDAMPILGIFANQDIDKNNEITYDYSGEGSSFVHEDNIQKKCFCNSRKCRQYLPFDASLAVN